jgi:hypothetical protein
MNTKTNPLALINRRPAFRIEQGDDVRWGHANAIELAAYRAEQTGARQVVTRCYDDDAIARFGESLRDAWLVQAWR